MRTGYGLACITVMNGLSTEVATYPVKHPVRLTPSPCRPTFFSSFWNLSKSLWMLQLNLPPQPLVTLTPALNYFYSSHSFLCPRKTHILLCIHKPKVHYPWNRVGKCLLQCVLHIIPEIPHTYCTPEVQPVLCCWHVHNGSIDWCLYHNFYDFCTIKICKGPCWFRALKKF